MKTRKTNVGSTGTVVYYTYSNQSIMRIKTNKQSYFLEIWIFRRNTIYIFRGQTQIFTRHGIMYKYWQTPVVWLILPWHPVLLDPTHVSLLEGLIADPPCKVIGRSDEMYRAMLRRTFDRIVEWILVGMLRRTSDRMSLLKDYIAQIWPSLRTCRICVRG